MKKITNLSELKSEIENIEVSYDFEDTYFKLYNTCIEYMNNTQNFELESLFEEYISYDIAEAMAKDQLEKGGLERLTYFMGDTNFYYRDIFRIDAYGNLHNITEEDLQFLKDEIIYAINQELEENI